MSEFHFKLKRLLNDHRSGSSTLVLRLSRLLRSELRKEGGYIKPDHLPRICQDVADTFPEMAVFYNFKRHVQASLRKKVTSSPSGMAKSLLEFDSNLKAYRHQAAEHMADHAVEAKILLTLNSSSAVAEAAVLMAEQSSPQLLICESQPAREGRMLTRKLREKGVNAECVLDAAVGSLIEFVDAVVLGADWVDDDGFINKTGSRLLSDLARLHLRPVYVVATSLQMAQRTGRARTQAIGPKHDQLTIPSDFERVPWNPAHRLVVEDGIRQPVPTHL